jgi:exopolysaccharide production protein ExoZ
MHWLRQQFELSRGDSQNDRSMEGLRGFAVFLVFLVHFVTLVKPFLSAGESFISAIDALHDIGNSGVDLFFVLSGYLIYGSLIARPQPFKGFIQRRINRIYPTFIVVFLAYVVLSFLFPAENKIPPTWIEGGVYLIQNLLLLPGLFPIEPMITVAWSLSYEMFYYLVIPLLITLLGLRQRTPAFRSVFFALFACVFTAYCATFGGPVRLMMFVAGMLLYEAMSSQRIASPSSTVGLIALAAGVFSTIIPSWNFAVQFVGFLVLCLACFRSPDSSLSRAFCWSPLRWLGNMSYSYYLIHGLALKAGFLFLSIVLAGSTYGAWFFWAAMPFMFVLTLLPSTLLFLTIERPLSLAPQLKRRPHGAASLVPI